MHFIIVGIKHVTGSSQINEVARDSQGGLAENAMSRLDSYASNRPPAGPSSSGHDYQGSLQQGSVQYKSSHSFDHQSPSSLDSRSANSLPQERHDTTNWEKLVNQNDGGKIAAKRKRADTSSPIDQVDNWQHLDTGNTANIRMGKISKNDQPGNLSVKDGDFTNFNMVSHSGQMESFTPLSGSMRSMLRVRQEGQSLMEKPLDLSSLSQPMLTASGSKNPEEVEISSAYGSSGLQQGGSVPTQEILPSRSLWSQNKAGLPFEKPQLSRFSPNVLRNSMISEFPAQQLVNSSIGSGKIIILCL